ncbi:MAG: FAD-dependent oxidoreductase [Planctomycetota bacterium]
MKRVVVLGGGFAGLSAVERLSHARGEVEVVLIDKRDARHFLPLLPDLVGRDLPPEALSFPHGPLEEKWGCIVRRDEVVRVDLERQTVRTMSDAFRYHYLLFATGSETSFYNRPEIRESALTLHSVDDALRIREAFREDHHAHAIVAGGGYTGVEIATHLWRASRAHGFQGSIHLVEFAPSLCPGLPEKFQAYVERQVRALGIEVHLQASIARIENHRVVLSDGQRFEDAMLVWTAGVRTADFIHALPCKMNHQGRLFVDPFLRVAPRAFAAGDVAAFPKGEGPLRMGVRFAITQGARAADNILRDIRNTPLRPYRSLDPGYVVPMGNGRGCGKVLGMPIRGRLPVWLHYTMCLYHSYGMENRRRLLKHLLAQSVRSGLS